MQLTCQRRRVWEFPLFLFPSVILRRISFSSSHRDCEELHCCCNYERGGSLLLIRGHRNASV